jgi:RP/EB family microtubule-associated protein
VEKLAKARYADNLEFAQWLKRFCQKNGEQQNYDAIARRGGVAVDFTFADKLVVPKIFNKINLH